MTSIQAGELAEAPARSRRLWLDALIVVAIYAFLWPKVTRDMSDTLVPWLDHILLHGQIGAFAIPFSNYDPPYLYLMALFSPLVTVMSKVSVIKTLSIVATLCLALAGRQLLRSAGVGQQPDAMLRLLLLPSVVLNAPALGQCDAFWSAACVMAVASAIERKAVPMLIWFGIGIAFKAQAVFLAPFVLLRLLQLRTPLRFWCLPVLVFALAMLPAALAGWPVADLAMIYLRQAEWNPAFISTAANPWAIVQLLAPVTGTHWFWLGDLAAAAAGLTYVAAFRRRESDAADLVALALLSACLIPFLLPKMHERFFFLADVLAFLLWIVRHDRRSMLIFFLVQGASVLALIGMMLVLPIAPAVGSTMVLAAMVMLVRELRAKRQTARTELRQASAPA